MILRTVRTMAAGIPGTKKLVHEYGDNFICLRYKVDTETNMRYKTVEVIIDEYPVKLSATWVRRRGISKKRRINSRV